MALQRGSLRERGWTVVQECRPSKFAGFVDRCGSPRKMDKQFKVKRRFGSGTWDPRPFIETTASSAKAAAEVVCGFPVAEKGLPLALCAEVWPIGLPGQKAL